METRNKCFHPGFAPHTLCEELESATEVTGFLKSYYLVCLAQNYDFTPRTRVLRVGSLLWEERMCCRWAVWPLEPVHKPLGSQYSQQPLAHQALVEVCFSTWAADVLLGGGTGKLPTAQK